MTKTGKSTEDVFHIALMRPIKSSNVWENSGMTFKKLLVSYPYIFFLTFKKNHCFLSRSLCITNFKIKRNWDHCTGPLWTVVFWKENKIKLFHVFWNVLSSVLYCEVPETMNQTKMDPSSTDDPATCVLFDCGSSINLSHCIKMPSVAGILIHFSFFLRLVYGISVSK